MEPSNPGAASPDGSQLNPAAPAPNATPAPVTSPPPVDNLSLDELNKLTGREFKSKDMALKSIKDTFDFATTRKTDIYNQVAAAQTEEARKTAESLAATQKELFYLQKPEFAPYRDLIGSLGPNPAEVVNSAIFKETFAKLSEHEKTSKLKTVLESNPRLAASRDGLSKAAELKKSQYGVVNENVEKLVTDAVIDAFDMRR